MSFCCIRIQSFSRIPSLNDLNERCSIKRYTVYLYVVNLAPNSTDFVSLPYDRTYVMTVDADDAVIDLPAFKQFLLLYKNLSDYGKAFLIILCISE